MLETTKQCLTSCCFVAAAAAAECSPAFCCDHSRQKLLAGAEEDL